MGEGIQGFPALKVSYSLVRKSRPSHIPGVGKKRVEVEVGNS